MEGRSLGEHAERLLDDLCERFPMGYRPALLWKPLRVSAGIAYWTRGHIGLSLYLLDTAERLEVTLVHEYAHLLAVHRHGKAGAGHGPHWQQAMRDLGAEPIVRHRYDVVRNAERQEVEYSCVLCGVKLRRHRRLPRNRKYVHAGCGGSLKLEGVWR
jgi:SprT protein